MSRHGNGKKVAVPNKTVGLKALKHNEATRRNIPTIENEALVSEDIKAPRAVDFKRSSVLLYPRKTEADPQLVWRGKDQEDFDGDLIVRSTPIYVHEHITPQHIVQSLRNDTLERGTLPELFERDFNGLTEDQRLRFYEFDGHWTNRMILGDSAAVMTSLSEKEGLRGKVQMVYFDPPYGISFGSNWQVAANNRQVRDGSLDSVTVDPEQIKAFRDTWRDGVHTYLSYVRNQCTVIHDLLTDSGSLFVQIGDQNAHLVRSVLDEVFGSTNYVATVNYTKTSGQTTEFLPVVTDYILWYAKKIDRLKYRQLFAKKEVGGDGGSAFQSVLLPDGLIRRLTLDERQDTSLLPSGSKVCSFADATSQRQNRPSGEGTAMHFPIEFEGRTFYPSGNRGWSTTKEGFERLRAAGRLIVVGNSLRVLKFLEDSPAFPINNTWTDTGVAGFTSDKRYVVETNTKVIERCIQMTTEPGDLILDPTCGAGTSAYCAEKWGRRWITIDTSRVALMIARENILSAKFSYYILADSHEGRLLNARLSGVALADAVPAPRGEVSKGFVLERVPRIGLKSIANNPDIKDGMTQAEIGEAIRRHAEMTYFADRPYIDKSIVRVSGPFTVESLTPTEAGPLDEENGSGGLRGEQGDFVSLVIENIRASGIVNGEKGGRTRFASVDPFPGEYINAIGVTEDGHRFGIAVGPKEGTVGPGYMRAAARDALNVAIVDTLAVCGFAFESVATTAMMGNLLVLKVRMNQDMQLGDMLKKSKRSFRAVLLTCALVEDDGGSVLSIVGSSWEQEHRSSARHVATGRRLKSAVS